MRSSAWIVVVALLGLPASALAQTPTPARPATQTPVFRTGVDLLTVDVTSDSHPFWTGAHRVLDTQGRVEKFERKYGRRTRRGEV